MFSTVFQLVVILFLGKLLAEASLEFKQNFLEHLLWAGLWRGNGRKRQNLCPFMRTSLTSHFFFTAALLLFPPSPMADFAFEPSLHLPVAVLLVCKFSSVRQRCVLQSVVLLLWEAF